jgi:hypothetical protein
MNYSPESWGIAIGRGRTLVKAFWITALVATILLAGASLSFTGKSDPTHSPNIAAAVYSLTRVRILDSNNVTLRPGSVYDTATFFESLLDLPRPGFNYEFLDAGLGAAEPVYPMFEKGNQGSYAQLIPAMFSENNRHIDHFATVEAPEGCRVDSAYLSRSLTEYPATVFKKERDEGYALFVLRFDYYTRLRPDAICGRHRTNDPDPNFDPKKFIESHHNAMYLSDFPKEPLERFEAKSGVLRHLRQTISPNWPKFDLTRLSDNSLWYYPEGHSFDYGISKPRPQHGLNDFNLPRHMVIEATPEMQTAFPFVSLLKGDEFQKVLNFWSGRPTADFDAEKEPGHDTLRLSDVTPTNIYTSGLYIETIKDVVSDVSDPRNFKLVAMSIKPYEQQDDITWEGLRVVPQIHFVYQLMDPRQPDHPFEQLYLHLKWDVVDRLADRDAQRKQHLQFLTRVDELTHAREAQAPEYPELVRKFIADVTSARPIEQVAFSSSLSGIWIFGALTRDQNQARDLLPMRIIRDGVDVGYYSSVHDTDVFLAEAEKATGERKKELQQHLDDLTVSIYRDPKRQNAEAINFNRVTCAQCHQTSARDGVHFSFNDELNGKIKSKVYVTAFFFHEAEEQLKKGTTYWSEAAAH